MSSTNRGGTPDPEEHYITPGWTTRAILPLLGAPRRILDLGCGGGAIGEECRKRWPYATIVGIEQSHERATEADARKLADGTPVYNAVGHNDILKLAPPTIDEVPYDLVISNPAFSLGVQFAHCAFSRVARGGHVAFLQRAPWLTCGERFEFAHFDPILGSRPHPAFDKHELSRRPSFAKVWCPCKKCEATGLVPNGVAQNGYGESEETFAKCGTCRGKKRTLDELKETFVGDYDVNDIDKLLAITGTWTTTDSATYAWHVWRPGDVMHGGRFTLLACEPPEKKTRTPQVRKARATKKSITPQADPAGAESETVV